MLTMPTYRRGDYVKVEFPDEDTGVGEWMWVRVHRCDDEKKLVFGSGQRPADLSSKQRTRNTV
jgi:hypothetical protein